MYTIMPNMNYRYTWKTYECTINAIVLKYNIVISSNNRAKLLA